MNIVFYLLVLLVLAALWFLIAFAFKPFGGFLLRLFKDAKDTMSEEDKNKDVN